MKKSQSILEEDQKIIHGDRRDDYGHPLDNHGLTAALWAAYLGCDITPEDVCFMNELQKISRAKTGGIITRDTLVDIAGYAANIEMIQDERLRRKEKSRLKSSAETAT